jgi:hypothetical protein
MTDPRNWVPNTELADWCRTLPVSAAYEIERLREALRAAQSCEEHHMNCAECEGLGAPEACAECFPLADDARLKRWAALGINQTT